MTALLYPEQPVLLVDDEENFLVSANFSLNSEGINHVVTEKDSRQVLATLTSQPVSVICLDMTMPHVTGWELLPRIHQDYPEIPVIVITAVNEVESAVKAMKNGAFDYLVKPVDNTRLITAVRRALQLRQAQNEVSLLKEYLLSDKLEHPDAFAHIITRSPAMRSIFQYIEAIAPTPLPMLITGETGTGKELIAQSIHSLSGRRGSFVAVNVAGVDDQLFSDTLFGHRRGAYTGADRDRKGLIEQAADGTLFLDEIGDLSLESQVKLLRLLQDGQYYPLGSDVPKLTDARIVVATHRNIGAMQQSDRFRKDLYYRLKAHHIHIPPLRDRLEDIPLLLVHFLEKAGSALGKKNPTPPRELITLLKNYTFPGNIREMEGMIFDAVSRHKSGVLSLETFRPLVISGKNEDFQRTIPNDEPAIIFGDSLPTLKEAEDTLIREALKRADGNQTIAAQILGLTRRALNNRLARSKNT